MIDVVTLATFVAVGGLLLLANFGELKPTVGIVSRVVTAFVVVSLPVVLELGTEAGRLSGQMTAAEYRQGHQTVAWLAAGAALALLYLVPAVERGVARVLPLRPGSAVHYTAVALALLLLAGQIGTQLSTDVFTAISAGPPLTNADILVQDIPFVAASLIGVGLFVRRPWRACLERLGVLLPKARWWLIAVAAIVLFILVARAIEIIAGALTPETVQRVSDATNTLFRHFNNPGSVIFLGVVAGIAEEILFRGAMQPRFGLLATSVLFAAVHTQYGITFASLEVFVLGLGLGFIRLKSRSTLPCIATHAGYDIAVGLIGLLR